MNIIAFRRSIHVECTYTHVRFRQPRLSPFIRFLNMVSTTATGPENGSRLDVRKSRNEWYDAKHNRTICPLHSESMHCSRKNTPPTVGLAEVHHTHAFVPSVFVEPPVDRWSEKRIKNLQTQKSLQYHPRPPPDIYIYIYIYIWIHEKGLKRREPTFESQLRS